MINSSFASGLKYGLKAQKRIEAARPVKGQKLLAQGSALGCFGRKSVAL